MHSNNFAAMRQPLHNKFFLYAALAVIFWFLPPNVYAGSCRLPNGTCNATTPDTAEECARYSGTYYTSMGCVGSTVTPTATPPPESILPPYQPITPRLQIPIPGLPQLSNVSVFTEDGRRVADIPFLAEYLAGLYRFLVGLAGLAATVMIIVGGMRWLLAAGDTGKIGAAKETITSATVGLIIALGSYIVLFALNPELVTFKSLRVTIVPADPLEVSLLTTTAPTDEGVEGEVPGSYTPTRTSCPFTLTATEEGARRAEFIEKIRTSGAITATSPREKVSQIAEIADICNAHLGSCGNTAGTISALAGLGDVSCLNPPSDKCGAPKRVIKAISQEQRRRIFGLRCDFTVGSSSSIDPKDPARAPYVRPTGSKVQDLPPCVMTGTEATRIIRDYLRAEATAGNLPGWPDEWADQLRPGDYVVLYNGNTDLTGSHAMIFMGWTSDGRMQVIQSSWGKPTNNGTVCVRNSCGDNMKPIIRMLSAG